MGGGGGSGAALAGAGAGVATAGAADALGGAGTLRVCAVEDEPSCCTVTGGANLVVEEPRYDGMPDVG